MISVVLPADSARTSGFWSTCSVPWLVGLLAFAFRLNAFGGFENDHFMHVAWARQLLMGAWPGRDFAEPGMPLMVLLSAAAQFVSPGFLSELVLTAALLGAAAGFVCAVTTTMTSSRLAGVVAGLATVAWYPRFYSYPKLLVPAVTLWLLLRYIRDRSARRLWALAGWSVAAFLMRHDLGMMAALATLAGIAALGDVPRRERAGAALRFVVLGLAIVAPYLLYVQMVEGLGEHIRVATEFGKTDQHQLRWTSPLAPESGARAVTVGPWRLSPEGALFWLYTLLVVTGGVWMLGPRAAHERSMVAAWVTFALLFRLVILRHPLAARLPDLAAVASLGAVIVAYRSLTRAVTSRPVRSVRALAGIVLAAVVALGGYVGVVSAWTVVGLGDRLNQAGVRVGGGSARRPSRSVRQAWDGRPWSNWPNRGQEPVTVDYLRRCLSPADRVLVTWFAPEYFVFSGRGFAGGHALFFPASFATDHDQALTLERLARESVPVVLLNETEKTAFGQSFPRLAAFIAEQYTVRAWFFHNADTRVGVAFRNDLHPKSDFESESWACGFD